MSCPRCGYQGIDVVAYAVYVTDANGVPMEPPMRCTCKRCGTTWETEAGGAIVEDSITERKERAGTLPAIIVTRRPLREQDEGEEPA